MLAGNVFGPFLLSSLRLALPNLGELRVSPLLVQKLCKPGERTSCDLIIGVFFVELA
jgi:hypothetical protein